MLARMSELATAAIDSSKNQADRLDADLEFQQLKVELNRMSEFSKYNRVNIVGPGSPKIIPLSEGESQTSLVRWGVGEKGTSVSVFSDGKSPQSFTAAQIAEFNLADPSWADLLEPDSQGTLNLTYSYSNLFDGGVNGLTDGEVRAAIEEAFTLWSTHAPLTFTEVEDTGPPPSDGSYSADGHAIIRIGTHYIDGPGGVLGHAFFPNEDGLGGDVHFDSGENWTLSVFLETAVHEIGHALGLDHQDPSVVAIMNPTLGNYFNGLGTSFLFQDDIDGIQALYGSRQGEVLEFQVGPDAGQVLDVQVVNVSAQSLGIAQDDIRHIPAAKAALEHLEGAITKLAEERVVLGSQTERLAYTLATNTSSTNNISQAEARLRDTDMATAASRMSAERVTANASVTMLSQANSMDRDLAITLVG